MGTTSADSRNAGVVVPVDGSQIPKDSVLLTPIQAYNLRMKQFRSWDKPSEIWPIVIGPVIAVTSTLLSGFTINFYARQMFQLYAQRYFWPVLTPIILFPPTTCYVLFSELVTKKIVLEKPQKSNDERTGCDSCLKLRAAAIQVGCSTVLPFSLSFITCSIASVTDRTYPVPSVTDYKGLLKTVTRLGRSFHLSGPALLIGNGLLGAGLAHLMINANRRAMDKQMEASEPLTFYPPIQH